MKVLNNNELAQVSGGLSNFDVYPFPLPIFVLDPAFRPVSGIQPLPDVVHNFLPGTIDSILFGDSMVTAGGIQEIVDPMFSVKPRN
ncbi:bacteriocin [Mixta theicola]|nr:bacteriocin [Mixta theicola]GLR08720.1 hypothetical protein GCM10007905_14390 [Mixta theicola]